MEIETFVVIDLETTGLPQKEYNRTKITEICLLAASRTDIKNTAFGKLPPMCKLSFMLNPEKTIAADSSRITGITDERVKNSPTFREKFNTLNAFLEDLKKPVCLVAHNGYNFDYRILLAECGDAKVSLPDDLICVDSLSIFRNISRNSTQPEKCIKIQADQGIISREKSFDSMDRSMNTDRSKNSSLPSQSTDVFEDPDWPEFNISPEEFKKIDVLVNPSLNTLSPSPTPTKGNKRKKIRESFKLSDIFTRYFGDMSDLTAHNAEDDCLMLLKCIVAGKEDFLKLADSDCKWLAECKPLERKTIFRS